MVVSLFRRPIKFEIDFIVVFLQARSVIQTDTDREPFNWTTARFHHSKLTVDQSQLRIRFGSAINLICIDTVRLYNLAAPRVPILVTEAVTFVDRLYNFYYSRNRQHQIAGTVQLADCSIGRMCN